MTDNITLPRKHIDYAAHALEHFNKDAPDPLVSEIIHHLRTALAAPRLEVTVDPRLTAEEAAAISAAIDARKKEQSEDIEALRRDAKQPKPEPVAWMDRFGSVVLGKGPYETFTTPLYTAPPATHPGYIIGSHWLETAYSRICAGEAEADVLRDCGWERVDDALRRDAERYRWLREKDGIAVDVTVFGSMEANLDAAIDAAMGDKT